MKLNLKEIKDKAFNKKFSDHLCLDTKLFRYVGIPLVWILQYTFITPNMISMLGILSIYASAILFGLNKPIAALILLFVAELCDHSDGTLARTKNKTTEFQSLFLEGIYHFVTIPLVFLGLGFYTNHYILGILACVFQFITHLIYEYNIRILTLKTDLKKDFKAKKAKYHFVKNESQRFIMNVLKWPMTYLKYIILLSYLFNVLDLMIIFYGLFVPLKAIIIFVKIYLSFGEMEEKNEKNNKKSNE